MAPKSLQADQYDDGTQRNVSNLDAATAARANQSAEPVGGGHSAVPPNYVKAYDEGRPRH
ncbi:MAG: hypothetical protein M3R70_08460 [Actinomycetota bacterium]|nr:hypothetical protein [Actinomycetota bacterium]